MVMRNFKNLRRLSRPYLWFRGLRQRRATPPRPPMSPVYVDGGATRWTALIPNTMQSLNGVEPPVTTAKTNGTHRTRADATRIPVAREYSGPPRCSTP